MSTFSSLQQRFFMRYVPEVMTTTTEDERQEAIAHALIEHPFGWLQDKAMDFFLHASPEMHRREALTRLLGVGDQRLYHVEHNLTDVPMRDMPTLHTMIQQRATINAALMAEDDEWFDNGSYIEDQHVMFNLWLTDIRNDALRFIIANSMSMEHAFLTQDLIHDAMKVYIPREVMIEEGDAGFQVHFHVEGDLHSMIWREMTRRSLKRAIYWVDEMGKATQDMGYPEQSVSVREEIDEHGYPLTTYCFTNPVMTHAIRLDRWDDDIAVLPRIDSNTHLEAIREQFTPLIMSDIARLYQELVLEAKDDTVTPLYTRDKGGSISLSPSFFDK